MASKSRWTANVAFNEKIFHLGIKKCSSCKEIKPIKHHFSPASNKFGVKARCRICCARDLASRNGRDFDSSRTSRAIRRDELFEEGKGLCSKCNKELPLRSFAKESSKSKYGLRTYCRTCDVEDPSEASRRIENENLADLDLKKCTLCRGVLDIRYFNKINDSALTPRCKICQSEYHARNDGVDVCQRTTVAEIKILNDMIFDLGLKCCRSCGKTKLLSDYPSEVRGRNGLMAVCSDCHKMRCADLDRKRRAVKADLKESFSVEDEKILRKAFNHSCFNCGSKSRLTVDHHKPLIKRNALSLSNAVLLCRSCNSSKNCKDPEDFYSKSDLEALQKIFEKMSRMAKSSPGQPHSNLNPRK